jgi:2-hydroxy-3-keto-5-methylthiopentenyl-1-phosphate phosphatase
VSGHVGLLVVDFDDTITEQDTIGALMTAAVEANVKVGPLVKSYYRKTT